MNMTAHEQIEQIKEIIKSAEQQDQDSMNRINIDKNEVEQLMKSLKEAEQILSEKMAAATLNELKNHPKNKD